MFFIAMTLLILSDAEAVGISPAQRSIDYESGATKRFSYGIYNNERIESRITLEVEGRLRDYAALSEKELNFSSGELMKQVELALSFPNKTLEQDEGLSIVAKESPKKGAFVNVQLEIKSKIDIKAPPRKTEEIKKEAKKEIPEIKEETPVKNLTVREIKKEKVSEEKTNYSLIATLVFLAVVYLVILIYNS